MSSGNTATLVVATVAVVSGLILLGDRQDPRQAATPPEAATPSDAGVTGTATTAGDPPSTEKVYDLDGCKAEFDADACEKAAAEAADEHQRIAPQYDTPETCQATTGASCVASPRHPGMYMPPMAGFLLGGIAGAAGATMLHASPLYQGPDPRCQTGNPSADCRNPTAGRASHFYGSGGYYGTGYGTGGQRQATGARFGTPAFVTRAVGVGPAFGSGAHSGLTSHAGTSAGRSVSISRGGFGMSAAGHGASGGG